MRSNCIKSGTAGVFRFVAALSYTLEWEAVLPSDTRRARVASCAQQLVNVLDLFVIFTQSSFAFVFNCFSFASLLLLASAAAHGRELPSNALLLQRVKMFLRCGKLFWIEFRARHINIEFYSMAAVLFWVGNLMVNKPPTTGRGGTPPRRHHMDAI